MLFIQKSRNISFSVEYIDMHVWWTTHRAQLPAQTDENLGQLTVDAPMYWTKNREISECNFKFILAAIVTMLLLL